MAACRAARSACDDPAARARLQPARPHAGDRARGDPQVVLGVVAGRPRHDPLAPAVPEVPRTGSATRRTSLAPYDARSRPHDRAAPAGAPSVQPLDGELSPDRERRAVADLGGAATTSCRCCCSRATRTARAMTDERDPRRDRDACIVAGHETTATSLAWAYERLTRDPARCGAWRTRSRTAEDRVREAVVRETLRVRARADERAARGCRSPIEIGRRRPSRPAACSPEHLPRRTARRALGPRRGRVPARALARGRRPRAPAWIPFGGGVRRCIGASFASWSRRSCCARSRAACTSSRVGDDEHAVGTVHHRPRPSAA